MFCKNCGNGINPGAVVCTNCGVPVGKGKGFCPNCAAITAEEAVVCVTCGAQLTDAPVNMPAGYIQRSRIVAGVLGILLGSLGIHNFYLGNTTTALIQLLMTVLSCGILSVVSGIWGLVEGIQILTGHINVDSKNIPLKD